MLKKMSIKRILVSSITLFALFLIYVIPKDSIRNLKDPKEELHYVDYDVETSPIYLLDNDSYLARATVVVNTKEKDIEARAKELLEVLIQDGVGESKVPNGFKSVLPSDTKIKSIRYDNYLIKVEFSKELLDVKEEQEEKLIEAIVYTLTSIKEIEKVIIYVDGNILTKLPKTKINLPSTLDRSYGINKKYDITTYKDVNQVTIYYVNKYNDEYYYVPVTKYLNDDRDKIKIIVDELSSTSLYHSNLMSFLDSNTKLLSVTTKENQMLLEFNEAIFHNMTDKDILEEVIYTISLSIKDNYDVEEVIFEVEKEQVHKSVLKEIE